MRILPPKFRQQTTINCNIKYFDKKPIIILLHVNADKKNHIKTTLITPVLLFMLF